MELMRDDTSPLGGVVERLIMEPLVNNSNTIINKPSQHNGKEITAARMKAKRQRVEEFDEIANNNEALYDAEMNKRLCLGNDELEDSLTPSFLPSSSYSYEEEEKPDDFGFIKDFFAEDLEQLRKEDEPIVPENCWACRVVSDNSPYAVFKNIWQEFMGAVEDLMNTGATIADMGRQLYILFHKEIVVRVRDISNGQCEITGGSENEEVWSAYSIMHHFLVHSVPPERLQWVLVKRYQYLLNLQFRCGVVKKHRHTGRECVDQKGLDTINNIVESLKKIYTWDIKKMGFSNNKDVPSISSGRMLYSNNSIRRISGGKNKPW